MPIVSTGKTVIRSEVQEEPAPVQPADLTKTQHRFGNIVVKNQPAPVVEEVKEVIKETPKKIIKKKKESILVKRNRTGIFNFDKSSSYMDDLLVTED